MDAVQAKLLALVLIAVAVKPVGTVGGCLSGADPLTIKVTSSTKKFVANDESVVAENCSLIV
jgi:hypothetical protein